VIYNAAQGNANSKLDLFAAEKKIKHTEYFSSLKSSSFSAPVQTGTGAHAASYTMGTGSLS
jgi:hypothetical protein